jgi:TetR/AcrR family transcriptional regulator, acrAB operon repressor
MVRRTKQESQQTRKQIIAAARTSFEQRGVTRTTMEHIAAAAGVTRGAVYWHFADKTALFYAMREEVALPLMDRSHMELLGEENRATPPLERVHHFLVAVVEAMVSCEDVRRTFEIMTFKCEYVDEFRKEFDQSRLAQQDILGMLTRVYREAQRAQALRPGLAGEVAAIDTMIFLGGLIKLWLMDEDGRMVRRRVKNLIATHIANHRAPLPPQG